MRPLVSVILSAYCHAPYVGRAMESVYGQTFQDFEFLIADDGSTDGTAEQIARHLRPGTRFFPHKQNRGACVVLNELLSICRGQYVALINSDDEFCPEKLEKQLAHLQLHPDAAAAFTWTRLIDEEGRPVEPSHPLQTLFDQPDRSRTQWLRRFFFEGNCLCHPSILARRERYGPFDPRLCKLPDLELWIRMAKQWELTVLPERLTRFRLLSGEQNASAARPGTLSLIELETPLLLDHYLTLTQEDCEAVFGRTGSPVLRRFYALTAALSRGPAAQAWGFRGLYALLGEPNARRELLSAGFDEPVLFRLGEASDVYSVLPYQARLYYASARDLRRRRNLSDALSESRCARLPAGPSEYFSYEFPLCRKAAYLRFDPAECPCRVRLTEASLLFSSGRKADLLPLLSHNGTADGEGILFLHFDPSISFLLPAELYGTTVTFSGFWRPVDPSEALRAAAQT